MNSALYMHPTFWKDFHWSSGHLKSCIETRGHSFSQRLIISSLYASTMQSTGSEVCARSWIIVQCFWLKIFYLRQSITQYPLKSLVIKTGREYRPIGAYCDTFTLTTNSKKHKSKMIILKVTWKYFLFSFEHKLCKLSCGVALILSNYTLSHFENDRDVTQRVEG